MPYIIIPRPVKLKVPRMQISPASGEFQMECHNEGNREFGIHVRPTEGTAVVTELVCLECGQVYKLDPQARLGGGHFKRRPGHEHIAV